MYQFSVSMDGGVGVRGLGRDRGSTVIMADEEAILLRGICITVSGVSYIVECAFSSEWRAVDM